MEHPPQSDALTALRAQLEARPRAMRNEEPFTALGDVVDAVHAALVEQARRQSQIAFAICVLENEVNCLLSRTAARWGSVSPAFTDETRERMRVIFEAGRTL